MPDELNDIITRAELAAILAFGERAPLTRAQAAAIGCTAVWQEAQRESVICLPADEMLSHLTLHALRVMREAHAGLVTNRETLADRIRDLPSDQQTAYSLRYEHGMSDAQIAVTLGRSEDDVVALMLGALDTLVKVTDDAAGR